MNIVKLPFFSYEFLVFYLLQCLGQFAGARFCSGREATGDAKQQLSSLRSFGHPCSFSEQPETGTFPPHFKVFAHCILLVQKLSPSSAHSNHSSFWGGITTEGEEKKKEKKMSTIFYTGVLISLFPKTNSLEFFML